jgi:hypothetical protein
MKKVFLLFITLLSFAHAKTPAEIQNFKQEVVHTVLGMEGWCSEEKALAFIDLILEMRPDVCVEIGVFAGRSFFPIVSTLKFLDHGTAIAIDPWDKVECLKYLDPTDDQSHMKWWGKLNMDHIYYLFLNTLRHHDLERHSKVIKSSSEKAASSIQTIDFLYLDGNHSQIVSALDVALYLPKVRSGGIICVNDTLWPQMQPAVDVLIEQCEMVQLLDNGNAIIFRKK